jgi:hypothetical protein
MVDAVEVLAAFVLLEFVAVAAVALLVAPRAAAPALPVALLFLLALVLWRR